MNTILSVYAMIIVVQAIIVYKGEYNESIKLYCEDYL